MQTRGRLALSWWLSGVVDRLGGGAAALKDLSSFILPMLSRLLPIINNLSCLVVKKLHLSIGNSRSEGNKWS
jgi:hypothetical protein